MAMFGRSLFLVVLYAHHVPAMFHVFGQSVGEAETGQKKTGPLVC